MKVTNELQEFSYALKLSKEQEGIVFLGCSGEAEDWIEPVTKDLIESDITSEKDVWLEIFIMKSTGGRRDVVMIFNGSKINIGKMAMWRLKFGGECSWLSDFVENYKGHYPPVVEANNKPKAKLVGADGNVFNLVGIASKALKRARQPEQAKEMNEKIFKCGSYDEALQTIMEYVDVE